MHAVDSLLMELGRESETTRRLLDRLPEDKLAWHAKRRIYCGMEPDSLIDRVNGPPLPNSPAPPSAAQALRNAGWAMPTALL
jgi:hypothetical protein